MIAALAALVCAQSSATYALWLTSSQQGTQVSRGARGRSSIGRETRDRPRYSVRTDRPGLLHRPGAHGAWTRVSTRTTRRCCNTSWAASTPPWSSSAPWPTAPSPVQSRSSSSFSPTRRPSTRASWRSCIMRCAGGCDPGRSGDWVEETGIWGRYPFLLTTPAPPFFPEVSHSLQHLNHRTNLPASSPRS